MTAEATVVVYEVRSDGEIAKARLAADGIEARVSVDDEGGLNPGFFSKYGVRLVVRAEDLDDAYGRFVAPNVVAVNHDHYFNFRLDLRGQWPQC